MQRKRIPGDVKCAPCSRCTARSASQFIHAERAMATTKTANFGCLQHDRRRVEAMQYSVGSAYTWTAARSNRTGQLAGSAKAGIGARRRKRVENCVSLSTRWTSQTSGLAHSHWQSERTYQMTESERHHERSRAVRQFQRKPGESLQRPVLRRRAESRSTRRRSRSGVRQHLSFAKARLGPTVWSFVNVSAVEFACLQRRHADDADLCMTGLDSHRRATQRAEGAPRAVSRSIHVVQIAQCARE